jgi:diguanylate cyclase (GGDEF)-like protein
VALTPLHRIKIPDAVAAPAVVPPPIPDLPALLRAIACVTFSWDPASDAMRWADNLAAVLPGVGVDRVDTGAKFAALIEVGGAARADALRHGGRYQAEYALRLAPGTPPLWVEECGYALADAAAGPVSVRGTIRAIDERRAREDELRLNAQRDPMTGELDRTRLIAELGDSITGVGRYRGVCSFMLLGVNHLSRINDAFGFSVADEVICEVARRIRPLLRSGDVLGRFSNNKFGVIVKNCAGDDMVPVAERFLGAIRDTVVATSSGPVAATISVGGVSIPRHARTARDAINHAQEALDLAKRRSAGSFVAWSPDTGRDSLRRMSVHMTEEIVSALNERRVMVAFEPVVVAATCVPAFHECLVRLTQPDGQLLMAPDIVPVAERVGLIRLVDHRVLELVIAELAEVADAHLSLNISPDTTSDPQWLANAASLLAAYPDVAGRLIVEITETQALDDSAETYAFVRRLKELGCRIAIDDFGAGYTSFRNLRRFDVDIVKIDGAFVQNLVRSADDRAFVQTLIDLARRLGISTVAEWVQDESTAALLTEWGCDYLQGRLIGLASATPPWRATDAATGAAARPSQP